MISKRLRIQYVVMLSLSLSLVQHDMMRFLFKYICDYSDTIKTLYKLN